MPAETSPRRALPEGAGIPIGVGIGAGIGLVFGLMLGQSALGLAVGAATGLVVGAGATTAHDVPANRRRRLIASTIAICAAGATVILLLWRG